MTTPKHLEGLISVIAAVEAACDGTDYTWVLRNDATRGYYASITSPNYSTGSYRAFGSNPANALAHALTEFNLRTRK